MCLGFCVTSQCVSTSKLAPGAVAVRCRVLKLVPLHSVWDVFLVSGLQAAAQHQGCPSLCRLRSVWEVAGKQDFEAAAHLHMRVDQHPQDRAPSVPRPAACLW